MLRPIAQLGDTEVEDLLFGDEAPVARRAVEIELKFETEKRHSTQPLRALIKRFAVQRKRAA